MRFWKISILLLLIADVVFSQPLQLQNGATQAAMIIEAETGNVIYEYNKDLWVTPASLTKLFTTASVLKNISPKAKYETKIYFDEESKSLFIKGSGDPTFNSKSFAWHKVEQLADKVFEQIKKQNISEIQSIVFDDKYVEGQPFSSKRMWEDMGNYYGATPSAFNIFDNTISLYLESPQTIGRSCKVVKSEPNVSRLPNSYVVSYSKSVDSVYVYGVSTDDWYVSGAMPIAKKQFRVRAAMFDTSKIFAEYFCKQLKDRGMEIYNISYVQIPQTIESMEPIVVLSSPTMEAIATITNQESNNLFADALMLKMAEQNGRTSWDKGVNRLNDFVFRTTKIQSRLYDGSGLSPFGKTTVRQVVTLLREVGQSSIGEEYRQTLATAGENGTLRSFGKGTTLEHHVKGKSGSMTGVVAYAGYIESSQKFIFCIIINNHIESNAKVKQSIATWLTNYVK